MKLIPWLVCAVLAVLAYFLKFHALGYGFSALVCLGFYLKSDKKDSVPLLRNCGWLPILAGAGNIFLNLLVMRLALTHLSPGLIYPVLSAGGLMVVTLFSIVLFREKLRKRQWIGIGTGALAIVLLSL